jgi:phospholipase C
MAKEIPSEQGCSEFPAGPIVSRRRLLGAAAAAGGSAFLARALPASVRRAVEEAPGGVPDRPRSLNQVEHVVVLMQENRSFDSYFGTLAGVRGFADPGAITLPDGKPVWYQPDPDNVDGYELPFHLDTRATSAAAVADLSHAWSVQHAAWDGGKMDNWVPAHRAADGSNGPLTMGYYTADDLPFHYALANAFTICDNYHCSVMGPTNPNRLYAWTGTIDPGGGNGGPVIDNSETPPYTWTTYPEMLQQAGVTWRNYQEADNYDDNPLAWFKQFQQAPQSSPLYQLGMAPVPDLVQAFADDVRTGSLPQVSWIIGPAATTEHPSYLPAAGAAFIASILEALASNPRIWQSTVLFLNYDENDGFFDHVPPPVPPPGTADEFVGGLPIGLGFRVPMIVISPFSAGGFVCSEVLDHTSTIQFMEKVFGVECTNISQWRRDTCGDLTAALNLQAPRRPFVPEFPPMGDGFLRAWRFRCRGHGKDRPPWQLLPG